MTKLLERHATTAAVIHGADSALRSILNSERRGISKPGFLAEVAVFTLIGAGAGAVALGVDAGWTAAIAKWTVTNTGYWSGFWKGFDFGAHWGAISGAVGGALMGVVAAVGSD
ncbi:MAG: hypothetical protein M1286_03770 [Candidatus Marsarchaeota archaeon]|nr:hypothetical protein [Candidatus Marsarchaeota archaeon]